MRNIKRLFAGTFAGVGFAALAVAPALAQQGLDEPFQASFKKALEGKTVGYLPVAMNFDLTEGWFAGVKKELEGAGISVRNDLQAAANNANATVKSAAAAATSKPGAKKPAGTVASTGPNTTATTSSAAKAKPKASKVDPYAGLVALPEATPKTRRTAVVTASSNGSTVESSAPSSPVRETSEAVMRARERRASAGYNRRTAAS